VLEEVSSLLCCGIVCLPQELSLVPREELQLCSPPIGPLRTPLR
jgi:hypothetical protein